MGATANKKLIAVLKSLLVVSGIVSWDLGLGAEIKNSMMAASKLNADAIVHLRSEITSLQRELTESKVRETSSNSQLKKIKKLLSLQAREIQLSEQRILQLNTSLDELSRRRLEVALRIEEQKKIIRKRLLELYKLAGVDHFGDRFKLLEILNADVFAQKSYFLNKVLTRDIASVHKLQGDVQEALALELKILEERNKLDYYVFELKDKSAELTANRQIHQEILKTNRVNHLEALKRIRSLRESEMELEQMLDQFQHKKSETSEPFSLASLKGQLELPVDGAIVSEFGRSFNPKTNLLTFQKGISIETAANSNVRAVHEGQVVYQGPLKNYGSIVILEHPGQYFSLYGQLAKTGLKVGDVLRKGELVGATSEAPFYFEIREKNVAVNPVQWINHQAVANFKNGGKHVVQ
ncbi:MAG TPA: peptidoglycan DD-metalloendopeptidase family protein [Oligoflexia bacterium]|nr:peptidoglycan DD-metalloendopeptidase family protein [Oligoflexia bacterium]